ncbi:MAG: hypothetical protein KBC94_21700 [Pseudacidovorax sp.]|uniref:hypothetical protein n=1 Tax=Pseudacidovorax sp. TaxID=1934311 RepID=UPI001B410790|nr:hypothetical protein [Pseudacidovorax sp.]MBP6897040.1 hypothetical protein [Pseudacidovorax sp.]
MYPQKFKASVQYDDWKGTSAADSADKGDAKDWLKSKGLIKDDEFLLGITLSAGESHGTHRDPVHVEFLLATPSDHDNVQEKINSANGPVDVRCVKLEMALLEFFGLFKRFSIYLSAHGMLDGYGYQCIDY